MPRHEPVEPEPHGGSRARKQREPQAARLDERPQGRQESCREAGLRARATDGKDQQRALAIGDRPGSEPARGLLAERVAKAPARVEPAEATREVATRDDEVGAAQELVGQREPREQDALGRNAIGAQAPHGPL